MLLREENPLASFKKDRYPEAFQDYLHKYEGVLDAIEKVYQEEEHPQQWLEKLADRMISEAKAEL